MQAPSVTPAAASAEPSRRMFWILLAAILALAAGLRLWQLDTPQLWEDDYLNLSRAALPADAIIAVQQRLGPADTIYDFQPPLHYLLLRAALAVQDSVLAARLPSLAAGLASILGLALLGAACAGRRAGLVVALLCTGSLFHVDISRAIKLYATFFCCSVFSMLLLTKAISAPRRRPLLLAGYAAVTAAMLWTGYQGLPILAAQGLWVIALFVGRKAPFDDPDRLSRLAAVALAMAVATAAWLPIAQGPFILQSFLANPGASLTPGLTFGFIADTLGGFFHSSYAASPVTVAGVLILAALGLLTCRNATTLLLILCAAVPAATLLTSRSDLRGIINWRHLIAALPAVTILAGAGASRLGGLFARPLPSRLAPAGALVVAGALAGLVLAGPLSQLGEYARRTLTNDRDFFRSVSRAPGPEAALTFTGWQRNARAFAARWHLGDAMAGPGDFDRPGYRRVLVADQIFAPGQRLRAAPEGALLASWSAAGLQSRLALAGFPSRAPLLLVPDTSGAAGYADDFRDHKAYRDAFSLQNMVADAEVSLLRPVRSSQPAAATWRFDLPPGSPAPKVTAVVEAALYKRHPSLPADSRLVIEASADGATFTPLATLGHDDFLLPDGTPRLEKRRFYEEVPFYQGVVRTARTEVDLTPYLATGSVRLRVRYLPGTSEGLLALAGVTVTGTGLAPVPDGGLAFYAANLARNCASPAYAPNVTFLGPRAMVFAAPDQAGLAETLPGGAVVNAPEALAAFSAANPDTPPAYVLPDAAGKPAVVVADPALGPGRGGAPLSDASPATGLELAGDAPLTVKTLTLDGRINAPVLTVGDARVPVPIAAPDGTVARLTPGGQGLLSFSPDFDPPDFTDRPTAHSLNMEASDSYPGYAGGVRCRAGTDCWFEYVFVSAFPVTELRVMAYPRLYGDAGTKRQCTVSYAADGGPLTTILSAEAEHDEQWNRMFDRRFARVRLPKPANQVTVRFTLVAEPSAEFWSPTRPIDRMTIEAVLDARNLPSVAVPPGRSELSLSGGPGNDFRVWFSDRTPGKERVWPGD
ncbi:glycosyltransferase family 39 protein [Solidesulfovibrio magneticus]|nr:glycosyltransferase family 39 protein [Solidesulfovibrio magneticus]